MPAGPKRELITLQRIAGSTRDAYGADIPVWEDLADVWAEVIQPTARQTVSLRAEQADVTTQFVIKYIAGVNATMRLLWNDLEYRIVEAPPPARPFGDILITAIGEAQDA